jgi:hypothetical protein
MTDIVKWLREQEDNLHLFIPPHECENFGKAADEIERLREALKEILLDCETDYPPSHGAIKYAIKQALREKE